MNLVFYIILFFIFSMIWKSFAKRICRKKGHMWVDKGNKVKCKRCRKKYNTVTKVIPDRKSHLE